MGKKKGGRPRKDGWRYPSGERHKPEKQEEGLPPAALGRMKSDYVKLVMDASMVTQVGQMMAARVLTNSQAATAFRIGEVYSRWHRLKQLRINPKTMSYEQGFGGSADVAEERMSIEQLEEHEARIKAAERDWKVIDDFLLTINREVRRVVLDLCVADIAIPWNYHGHIKQVLDALALRWGPDWKKGKGKTGAASRLLQSSADISQLQAERPKREDPGLKAVALVAKALRPDLDDTAIAQVRSTWAALRDRERFRQRGRS